MSPSEFHIHSDFQQALKSANLDRFEALMHEPVGKAVHQSNSSQVLRLELPGSGNSVSVFYLKRTLREKSRHALQMLLRGLRPHVESYREMQGISILQQYGFPAMQIAAWGEQRFAGFPLRGFLLSLEVRGQDAQKLFDSGDPATRTAILQTLGELHGKLNAAGFCQALRFKDVFLDRDDADGALRPTLIDRSALWVWPKSFLPRHHCRVSLTRSARRLRSNHVRMTPQEIQIYAEAYVRSVFPRWRTNAEEIVRLLSRPQASNRRFHPEPAS